MGGLLYEGVAAELRELVSTLPPGDRLPSESQLKDDLKATRGTVRSALQLLEREGLIVSRQGRGWYVTEHDPVQWYASRPERGSIDDGSAGPTDSWSRGVREQGRTPSEDRELGILEAEPRIARRLELAADDCYVVVRRRMRYVDGTLNNSNDTYYPKSLVDGTPIAEPGDVLPGAFTVVEQLGHGWRTRRDEKVARPATAAEAARFGIEVGWPVMETIRTRFDQEKRPVAVSIIVAPGGRSIDIYEGDS